MTTLEYKQVQVLSRETWKEYYIELTIKQMPH